DRNGSLFPFHVENSQPTFAIRPGVVYTGSGTVRIGLPAGSYTLYASRGFEYSVRTQHFTLPPGRTYPLPMRIRRELPTQGQAAHFNVFPVQAGSRVPNHHITDWPKLMEELRAAPGVRVVVLNHPRNVHSNFQPFADKNFNPVTGENRRGFEFSFDAMEAINSSALQSDLMLTFRDWFALLNYGYRVTAV